MSDRVNDNELSLPPKDEEERSSSSLVVGESKSIAADSHPRSNAGKKAIHAKEKVLKSLAQRRESAVQVLVKETLREMPLVSTSDMERLEEEIEARVMRKLLQERQQYMLRDENGTDEEAEEEVKTEIDGSQQNAMSDSSRRRRARHLDLPTSIPQQGKVAVNVRESHAPGAVRVAGIDASAFSSELLCEPEHNADYDDDDHESPVLDDIDRSSATQMQMQTPQASIPDYFREQIMLEATLVTSSHLRRDSERSSLENFTQPADNGVLVEAKPLHGAYSDLRCTDVIKSKRLCSRIFISAILIIGIILAVGLPLIMKRVNAADDDQPQETGPPTMTQDSDDPSNTESRANLWLLNDPNYANYSSQQRQQRFALAAFFYSTGGENWTRNDRWLDYDTHECQWYMAHGKETSCTDEGVMQELNLTNNNIRGIVGEAMRLLPDLKIIDLSNNHLYGNIPAISFAAQKLEVVDISNNALSGFLTSQIGFSNANIRIFRNRGNNFTGNFPSLLSLAPNLVELDCTDNRVDGTIPESIGGMTKLEVLRFGYSQVVGTLPSQIGALQSLRVLDFPHSGLEGAIPSSFSNLVNLESADWSHTSLTGEVPDGLCLLEALGQLKLSLNCEKVLCCQ